MIGALVLADDATGALELGALLAAEGISATVSFDREAPPSNEADALVIDTETRHVAPEEARHIVLKAARNFPAPYVYKKTDSTLRGNIAAEFAGLMEVYPDRTLHFAPAYPALGRTVVNGTLLVNGVPVAQTEFAADRFNPIVESHIPTLLGTSVYVVIPDGSTELDISQLPVSANVLASGSGGYARHWIKHLPLPRRQVPVLPRVRTLHVVCGSLHPASLRQAECARPLRNVTVMTGQDPEPPDPLPDAVIIFGGDTAYQLLTSMDIRDLAPLGEVLPGVPLSLARYRDSPLIVITKAGGFGDDRLVALIQQRLQP
jgi:uncharacterized protein YgbK (DUF1537 family)